MGNEKPDQTNFSSFKWHSKIKKESLPLSSPLPEESPQDVLHRKKWPQGLRDPLYGATPPSLCFSLVITKLNTLKQEEEGEAEERKESIFSGPSAQNKEN